MSDSAFILNRHTRAREYFDPTNQRHLDELRTFIKTGRWATTCPFYLEQPFLDIPGMCARKYLEHSLE